MATLRCRCWLGTCMLLAISVVAQATYVLDNPTKLVTATYSGGLSVDGYSLMLGSSNSAPTLSYAAGGTNNLVLGPLSLAFSPAAIGAACVGFTFEAINSSQGLDAFLSYTDDVQAMIDSGAQFDASMAAPLGQSDFRGVKSCNSTVATDVSKSYTFVIMNQHTQPINVTYSFSALTADYPGCQGAPAATGSTASLVQQPNTTTAEASAIGFDEGYILAPGERFSVALFNNASCVAFELPGASNASAEVWGLVASVQDSLSWMALFLQGSQTPLPAQSGALCRQDPSLPVNQTTADGVVLAGAAAAAASGYFPVPGDAHVASPQACLLVVDSLDPSQLYYLWLYNAFDGMDSLVKVRYGARSSGSCAGVAFAAPEDPGTVVTSSMLYEQNVVQGGFKFAVQPASPVYPPAAAAIPGPKTTANDASSQLSAGAIAGIVIGAVALKGAVVLLVLRYLGIRRRRPSKPAWQLAKEGRAYIPRLGPFNRDPDLESGGKSVELGYVFEYPKAQASPFDSAASPYIAVVKQPPSSQEAVDLPMESGASSDADAVAVSIEEKAAPASGGGGSEPESYAAVSMIGTDLSGAPSQRSKCQEEGEGPPVADQPEEAPVTSGTDLEGAEQLASTISEPGSSTAGEAGSWVPWAEPAACDALELPQLSGSEWQMDPADVEILQDPDEQPIQLGAGSFGSVYKARLSQAQEVAVKVFRDAHCREQQAAVMREVAILMSCRHPSIVQFMGACHKDRNMMLVMELLAGGDMYSALKRDAARGSRQLSWYRRGQQVATDIAKGLHYLHFRKMIHLDLKSSNVLLTSGGRAKITDVGFANILTSNATCVWDASAGMNLAWAAPEVLLGRQCSAKADVFSLGVILHEICTGEAPRRSQMAPLLCPQHCPQQIADLIESCTSMGPEQRPSSLEVVELLQSITEPSRGSQ